MNEEITDKDLTTPLNRPMKEFPLLPEREWLKAKIDKVDYRIAQFQGKTQYLTDQEQNPILDKAGEPIPRKEFNITFILKDYQIDNGSPRKAWLRLGASLGKGANLPTFLINMRVAGSESTTPQDIILDLEGQDVEFQLANKPREGKQPFQVVLFDTVRPDNN